MTSDASTVAFRRVRDEDLPVVLELYRHLHAADAPLPAPDALQRIWNELLTDAKVHLIVGDLEGQRVACCTLTMIPNLTRGARPYGLIENVVTHGEIRRQGVGSRLMRHALQIAWDHDCYKVMLMTGQEREEVHRFYERAGFRKDVKTGFVAHPA